MFDFSGIFFSTVLKRSERVEEYDEIVPEGNHGVSVCPTLYFQIQLCLFFFF